MQPSFTFDMDLLGQIQEDRGYETPNPQLEGHIATILISIKRA